MSAQEFTKNATSVEHFISSHVLNGQKLTRSQKRILNNIDKNILLVKSRRVGVTTLILGYILHRMTFKNDQRILVRLPTHDMATSIFNTFYNMWRNLPTYISQPNAGKHLSEIEFKNGSKVIFTAYSAFGKGEMWDMVFIEEAAFFKNLKDIMAAFLPMLKTNGTIIVSSTPNGKNFFYTMYHLAKTKKLNTWIAIRVTWKSIPGISKEEIENIRHTLGTTTFKVEYEANFGASSWQM